MAVGAYLGVKAAKARKKSKPKVKKNPGAVLALAGAMFAYGLFKGKFLAAHSLSDPGCPMCVTSGLEAATDRIRPRHMIKSVVTGPLTEELLFRHTLQPLVGAQASGVAFGALHASPNLGVLANMARVMEAGLSGALVYGHAYTHGGLLGSTLVHAAHNVGARLGTYSGMQDQHRRISGG